VSSGSTGRMGKRESYVTHICDFKENLRQRRASDEEWGRFVRDCETDFVFFKTVMGSSTMTFLEFAKHMLANGAEVRKDFNERNAEGKAEFWRTVRRVNLEIRLFPNES